MAISNKTRVFEIKGKMFRFNKESFTFLFDEFCQKYKFTKEELEYKMAEELSISHSAIHNWRNGLNGPSSLDMIESVANFFRVDYFRLLKEKVEMEEKTIINKQCSGNYTDLQLISLKRIYDSIISFLDEFNNTGGFTTDMWYDYLEKGVKDPESAIYDYIEKKMNSIYVLILQEYFYLHDLSIYDEINEYFSNDLYDLFNGKLGYAYRFEAYAEGNPTTDEDYSKALDKINKIIVNAIKNA